MSTKAYRTKSKKLSGSNYGEVHKKALDLYSQIAKRSKRRPYIRPAYFKKDKIFLGIFWHHLGDKFNNKDKLRRLIFPWEESEKALRQLVAYKPRPKAFTQ